MPSDGTSKPDSAELRLQSVLSAVDSCESLMSSLASHVPKEVCDHESVAGDTSKKCYTYTSHAYPQSFLPPRQCCGACSIQASHVRVNFWASESGPTTSPQSPYTLVSDGYTFTSPSVYVVYSELYARAECTLYGDGQIGNNISETTIAYPPDALSTARCYQPGVGGFRGWETIDYEDWQKPSPNSIAATRSGCRLLGKATLFDPTGTDLIASPQFSLPQDVSTLQPLWGEFGCRPWRYGAFDPPRTLTRADAMVPDPQSPTQAALATPAAEVAPPVVTPTAADPAKLTSAAVPQDPQDLKKDPAPDSLLESQNPDSKPAPTSRASNAANEDAPAASQDLKDPKDPEKDPAAKPVTELQNLDPKPTTASQALNAEIKDLPAASPGPKAPPKAPSSNGQVTDDLPPPPTPTKQDSNTESGPSQTAEENPPNLQQNLPAPALTVGSLTYQYHLDPASNLIIASQTAVAGGPPISVSGVQIGFVSSANEIIIDGTHVPMAGPAATADRSFAFGNEVVTANSASQYIVQGQTLTPGAPAFTISSTPISLAVSAAHVVVGSDTIPLPDPSPAVPPAITVGNQAFTADSLSNFAIGDQTLVPGAPAVTISGTPISLAPFATQAVVGSSIIPLVQSYPPNLPTAVVNGQTTTANSASQLIFGSQTISPGGPAVTISGTPISIPSPSQPSITIGSQAYPYTLDTSGNILIASQTLRPGGSPVTVSGITVSQAYDNSEIVVALGSSTTSEGLGEIINGALGRTGALSSSGEGDATSTAVAFTGKASRRVGEWGWFWWVGWVVVGGFWFVWH